MRYACTVRTTVLEYAATVFLAQRVLSTPQVLLQLDEFGARERAAAVHVKARHERARGVEIRLPRKHLQELDSIHFSRPILVCGYELFEQRLEAVDARTGARREATAGLRRGRRARRRARPAPLSRRRGRWGSYLRRHRRVVNDDRRALRRHPAERTRRRGTALAARRRHRRGGPTALLRRQTKKIEANKIIDEHTKKNMSKQNK